MRGVLACIAVILLSGCVDNPGVDATALQVPVLSVAPELDRRASPGEWDAAVPIHGVFTIKDGTMADGNYPFDLRLGHDDAWLFALMVVHDVAFPNPFNGQPDPSNRYPWSFSLFLDTKLGQSLQPPADWKFFTNFGPVGSSSTDDGYWTGTEWVLQNEGDDPHHLPWNGNRPGSGTWGRGWYEGHDLLWEIYVPLKPPSPSHDGFEPYKHGVFRMGLMFTVQGIDSPDGRGLFMDPHDTYPGDGYTPNNHYDPSTWMRLQLA